MKLLLKVEFSDHHPLTISFNGHYHGTFSKPFKFSCAWLTHLTNRDMVKNSWHEKNVFLSNISRLKENLSRWKRDVSGETQVKRKMFLARIGGIQ